MKSIQMTAILLWVGIFIIAAFIAGQILASKNIFDVTGFITGTKTGDEKEKEEKVEDELANDIVIDKIGQETVRIGLNVAKEYFSEYYKEYINYIISNTDSYPNDEKILINETLASDYVFYAILRKIDNNKYISNDYNDNIIIKESEVNSFIDKMFNKEIDETFKKDGKYGYDKVNKEYSMEKNDQHYRYVQELENIENITSNEIILTYTCRRTDDENSKIQEQYTVKLTVIYKGGRYIVTEVQRQE